MRRLLILRHAKAVEPSGADDFERTLTPRGRADAAKIGVFLNTHGLKPDLSLYSGAARTRETFEIVAQQQSQPIEGAPQNALYEASRFLIMGLLRDLPATARASLIVGHNPGMAEVAALLTGEGASKDRLRLATKFPTGALAVIAFDCPDWSDLAAGAGRLEHFVTPADLPEPP